MSPPGRYGPIAAFVVLRSEPSRPSKSSSSLPTKQPPCGGVETLSSDVVPWWSCRHWRMRDYLGCSLSRGRCTAAIVARGRCPVKRAKCGFLVVLVICGRRFKAGMPDGGSRSPACRNVWWNEWGLCIVHFATPVFMRVLTDPSSTTQPQKSRPDGTSGRLFLVRFFLSQVSWPGRGVLDRSRLLRCHRVLKTQIPLTRKYTAIPLRLATMAKPTTNGLPTLVSCVNV